MIDNIKKKLAYLLCMSITPYLTSTFTTHTLSFTYQQALKKWGHLFNRLIITDDTVNSKDIIKARLDSAKELLAMHPQLISAKSLSNDTCFTFIQFLRTRPNSPNDAYWTPIMHYFTSLLPCPALY